MAVHAHGAWGHCKHCTFFGSPAKLPLDDEEARCEQPVLSKYHLLVFGSNGCNSFKLRAGLSEASERPIGM